MSSGPEVIGNPNPYLVIQENDRACLPACLLSVLGPDTEFNEAAVVDTMTEDGLFKPGPFGGTGLYSATTLDRSVSKFGLRATPVFDAAFASPDEQPLIEQRLTAVDAALQNGEMVMISYPKYRPCQEPIWHYSLVANYQETDDGTELTIVDPSDVDGSVYKIGWQDFIDLLTPTEDIPVMAWGVSKRKPTDSAPGHVTTRQLLTRDLLVDPLCDEADNGIPIPPYTEHPTSVTIATTALTKQFSQKPSGAVLLSKNGNPEVGYSRFVVPGQVKSLAYETFGRENMLPFPTKVAAVSAAYLSRTYMNEYPEDFEIHERAGVFWIQGSDMNLSAWQHTGLGLSSRQAQAILDGRPANDIELRSAAERVIKQEIEQHTGAIQEDIYLFQTGMAAIYTLNQALAAVRQTASVQFGFPYSDTFEQRKFGPHQGVSKNIHDLRDGSYEKLGQLVGEGAELRALMTEYTGNPKLWTPDYARLHDITNGNVPIVIDDTIGTMYNLDDDKLPDSVAARVTSLTKYFSGGADVMGGSIVLRPESPHYHELKQALDAIYQDMLWYEDAEVLAANSAKFSELMPAVNANGEAIADWLQDVWVDRQGVLKQVHHPNHVTTREYDAVRKAKGGRGGLMTLEFVNPERAYRFYDNLRFNKGPSLGPEFTLACLYTWLAHPNLKSVEQFGVLPDYVRISAGREDSHDLMGVMSDAMLASAA